MRFGMDKLGAAAVLAHAFSTLKKRIVKTPGRDWNPGLFSISRISRSKHSNLGILYKAYLSPSHPISRSPNFKPLFVCLNLFE